MKNIQNCETVKNIHLKVFGFFL